IDRTKIPLPPVINFIMTAGDISQDEAFNVWNMGLGYTLVVNKTDADTIKRIVPSSFVCGEVV
ncbi:MAG: hypothetical protein RJB13_2365, partial [Pseudomonadota bacterium]